MASAESSKPLHIIVVGGSLAGLLVSIPLLRPPHSNNITILERSPSHLLQSQGAGIVAQPSVQDFFTHYDRTRTPITVRSRVRQYLNRKGAVIDREEREQKMTSWDLLYEVLRANFDGGAKGGYIRDDVSGRKEEIDGRARYLPGRRVTKVEDLGASGVKVTCVNGENEEEEEDVTGDILIGADGPSSTVRRLLTPEVERKYAGYVCWRGTLPEADASTEVYDCFAEKFTFFHAKGSQILAYLIPGPNGAVNPGSRLLNWVYYQNAADTPTSTSTSTSTSTISPTPYHKLMTDSSSHFHPISLPVGKVPQDTIDELHSTATATLPPQFSALVTSTSQPFIQAITDVLSRQHVFWHGRCILVGDAVAGFRPHTAASTGQAAMQALRLARVRHLGGRSRAASGDDEDERDEVKGGLDLTLEEWERSTREYAMETARRGREMGDRSQFGEHPMADREGR